MNKEIEFHWTKTQRGAPAIQIDTNLYRIQKRNNNGSIRFTCTDERCNASVTLLNDKIKFIRGTHRHGERVPPFHILQVVHEFRQKAVSDIRTPLPRIYDQRRQYGTAAEIPMFQQLRSTGYRKRLEILPPSPKKTNIRTFIIPEVFRLNLSNEPFLIHDSANPDRIIVFASKKSLNYLGTCSVIYSDGTFKTAPRYFKQAYTIHAWSADTGMKSICYSATTKKDVRTYLTLFQSLKDAAAVLGINLAPSSHMIDFESAAAIASKKVFNNVNISFCHFHFAKSIWRNLKNKNLALEARKTDIKNYIADIIALPMVPVHLVRQRFDSISRELHMKNLFFNSFISYVRRTYINSKNFPIHSWNHFNFLGTRPRTNNHVEGSHRQLKNRILSKPNIWLWIMSIQDLDESTIIAIEQEEHQNRQTRPRQRQNIERDEDLLDLKRKFQTHIIDIEELAKEIVNRLYAYS
ncbi:unnamed protein product [Rotaria sordida]|uniref:MULE transposase domain-containing protein n=1 Tax=Rotaria sordida TaxID=392033 RepID=A0A819HF00_9BILA|nr:unnamed protein product [Rotaria sordida]